MRLRIIPKLEEQNRWADVAAFYPKPLEALAEADGMRADASRLGPDAPPSMQENFRKYAENHLRTTAARLVRALATAGRTEEAATVRGEALRLDPSAEMAIALGAATTDA